MDTSKLVPGDERVQYLTAKLRGKNYAYMVGEPASSLKATVFLIHGFPDIGFGWRNQIPVLMNAGYRVVVPDLLGFGSTEAPQDLKEYALKSMAADIRELIISFVGENGQIILGGHDWGGALVWKIIQWFPELIKAVFVACTPYAAPLLKYMDVETLVSSGMLPNFGYQLQLKGPDVESAIQSQEKIRQFLNGMFGGRYFNGPDDKVGKAVFSDKKGVYLDLLHGLRKSPLVSDAELDYYTKKYMEQPAPQLRGGLNWYRTRRLNYEDDVPLLDKKLRFELPTLFITASRDTALPPSMSAGMGKYFSHLSRADVVSSHWVLVEAAKEVNKHILKFIDEAMGGSPKPAL